MGFSEKLRGYARESEYFIHETKKSVILKFLLVVVVVAAYFFFISMQYGLNNGLVVTFLTWSFFVLCTPIADAGFLLDFPVRLITGIRMLYSEILVWLVAISANFYFLTFAPDVYNKTLMLRLFEYILLNPFPFWAIIFISSIGTFMSVYFGDELITVSKHADRKGYIKHKNKHTLIIVLFLLGVVIVLYDFLLKQLGVHLI